MTEEEKQDDSIIELTDVLEDGEPEDELSDDILSEDEIPEDGVIELTDMEDLTGLEIDPEPAVEEIAMDDSFRDEASGQRPEPDNSDAAESASDKGGDPADLEEISVSDAQIEAALERFIEKKFAEKIEPLLFDTMERVILQEIQKMKNALLKDMDRIGPF